MSGHSKWAGIKHKKGLADAKKGAVFTKITKELTLAARLSGGDPDSNPRLRLAMAKAKEANMPKDNTEKAIKRGTGELPGVVYEEVTYEGYGPAGVAIFIEVTTDNKNRATAELRNILDKRGGNLAGAGSVAWMFQKKGFITVSKAAVGEDKLMSLVLDAGAEDFKVEEDDYEITIAPKDFEAVKKSLDDNKIETKVAEITMLPSTNIKLTGGQAKQVLALVEALEDHEDVQNVYSNFDIPDAILKELAQEK